MTGPCRMLISLCLALAPMVANAQEPNTKTFRWKAIIDQRVAENLGSYERVLNGQKTERPHSTRFILLRREPTDKVREIYIAGGVPTIIHLPAKLHVRGTGIESGGRHRFDILMGGRQILITPKENLADGERFSMWVALADGTVILFSLTRAPEGERTDGEVRIQRSPDWAQAVELRAQLVVMTDKAVGFEASLRQALKERESQFYALADLIVGGHAELTALPLVGNRPLPSVAGRSIGLVTFASRKKNEIAALLSVDNKTPQPLDLSTGRLFRLSSSEPIPFALRARPAVVPPGGKGYVAVVMDREEVFGPDGDEKALLDFLSTHQGGSLELSALLTPGHFAVQEAEPPTGQNTSSRSWWWPF